MIKLSLRLFILVLSLQRIAIADQFPLTYQVSSYSHANNGFYYYIDQYGQPQRVPVHSRPSGQIHPMLIRQIQLSLISTFAKKGLVKANISNRSKYSTLDSKDLPDLVPLDGNGDAGDIDLKVKDTAKPDLGPDNSSTSSQSSPSIAQVEEIESCILRGHSKCSDGGVSLLFQCTDKSGRNFLGQSTTAFSKKMEDSPKEFGLGSKVDVRELEELTGMKGKELIGHLIAEKSCMKGHSGGFGLARNCVNAQKHQQLKDTCPNKDKCFYLADCLDPKEQKIFKVTFLCKCGLSDGPDFIKECQNKGRLLSIGKLPHKNGRGKSFGNQK